jgi:hypothetical protein
MTKKMFHDKLAEYMHRQPFEPFVAKLRDGRDLKISNPLAVSADGGASFIDLDGDGALVGFTHKEVKMFVALGQESTV